MLGSILPLKVTSDYSSHGDSTSSDVLTILLQHPASHSDDHSEIKHVYEFAKSGMILAYNFSKSEQTLRFQATAHESTNLLLLVRGIQWHGGLQVSVQSSDVAESFGEVEVESAEECRMALRKMESGYCKGESSLGEMWIRPGSGSLGLIVEISNLMPL